MTWRNVTSEELARLEAMMAQPNFIKNGTPIGMSDFAKSVSKASKYRNQKTRGFHSKKEADRYDELVMMQKAGIIRNLRCQVPYVLLEPFRYLGKWYSGIKYFADFVYEDRLMNDWITITEDSKSIATEKDKTYRLKRQLLLAKYPDINFIET